MRIAGCYIPEERRRHFAPRALPEEVHEVLENEEWRPVWRRTTALGQSRTYLVYGRTESGRYLFIPGILFSDPPLDNVFMPITVRDMTTGEKEYDASQGR